MKKLILAFAALLFLVACQNQTTKIVHQINLTPAERGSGIPAKLEDGQSFVTGLDNGAVHLPEVNRVTIDIYTFTDLDVVRAEQPPRQPRVHLTARHYIRYGDDWVSVKHVKLEKLGSERVQDFRYLIVNYGDKPFQGDLVVQGNPGPDLCFLGVTQVRKIRDERELKEALAFVPPIGVLALAMENYPVVDAAPVYFLEEMDGQYRFLVRDVTLGSYEGVLIEYKAALAPTLP